MTFFYNLNKKLDEIRATPETTHKQLNERDEGKPGKMFAKISADAAKRYGSKAAGDRVAGKIRADKAKAGTLEENAAAGYSPEMQARIKTATPQQLAQMAQELAGGPAQYQSELKMLQQAKAELSGQMEEGFVDTVKSGAQAALQAIGNTLGHGSDEDMIRDLQKKAGVPVTGKVPPQQPGQNPTMAGQKPMAEADIEEGPEVFKLKADAAKKAGEKEFKGPDGKMYPVKEMKKSFSDKIAGAKQEVDEMLGDVAAEAMKNALRGGQKKLDKNKNGKLDAMDFEILRKGARQETDEGWDDMLKDVEKRHGQMKTGEKKKTSKGEVEKTATGIRHTRSYDAKTGETDTGDDSPAAGEKRGRGRPKKTDKAPERVTAKAYKHKGGRKSVDEGSDEGSDLVKLSKVIASCKTHDQLLAAQKMANNFLAKHVKGGISNIGSDVRRRNDVDATLQQKNKELGGVEEEAVSKAQRRAAGIAHAAQKGEISKSKLKGASKEMAKMPKGELKKFASTKEKGLPNKKEKTEETTTAGSVAPAEGGKSKGNSLIGKGIYDSLNRDLEAMIAESMNVSVNMSQDEHGEPHKNITVSAEGEAAEQLAQLLNLAGMDAQQDGDTGCGCDTDPCSCEELDENQPDWPNNTEIGGKDDPHLRMYAGGLNGPKSTGQADGAPPALQPQRQGVMGEGKDLGMQLYAELKSFKG